MLSNLPKDENTVPSDSCSNQARKPPEMSSNLWVLCDDLICSFNLLQILRLW